MTLPLVDLLLIGIGSLATLGLLAALFVGRRRAERLLRRRVDESAPAAPALAEVDPLGPDGGWDRRFAAALDRAGVEMPVEQWSAIVALAAIVGALALVAATGDGAAALAGLALGGLVPFAALRLIRNRRRRRLQDQLPDAIFLLARAMRAGSGLERSLVLCADQTPEPLRGEIRRALRRVDLGLSVPTALAGMADRVELEDLDMLVATVRLHQATGGNLARLVDLIAAGARARNQFRAQVRSATSLSRASAAFVASAMPVLLVVYSFVEPDFLAAFLRSSSGQIALAVALALEIVGSVWLYLILRVRL